MYHKIGQKIRNLRKETDMTLKELSDKTDLSVSFLSQLERGITTIAIDSLDSLASVFGLPITYFFESDIPVNGSQNIVRRHERQIIIADQSVVQYALSRDVQKCLFPCLYELPPCSVREKIELYRHKGEEFVYVLSGILTVVLEMKTYELYPGDSFHISASLSHNVQNNTSDLVQYISVCMPPIGEELVKQI